MPVLAVMAAALMAVTGAVEGTAASAGQAPPAAAALAAAGWGAHLTSLEVYAPAHCALTVSMPHTALLSVSCLQMILPL